MTAGERNLLAQAIEILGRVDDRLESMDGRLRGVESYITADKTRKATAAEIQQSNRLNRAQILTAAGIVGSFVLGLLNHFS